MSSYSLVDERAEKKSWMHTNTMNLWGEDGFLRKNEEKTVANFMAASYTDETFQPVGGTTENIRG